MPPWLSRSVKARLSSLGVEAMPMTSASFAKFINDESAKWTPVIKCRWH